MQRGLSLNDRYALAFAQGYNRQQDLGSTFRSGGLSSLENPSVDLWRALAGYAPGERKPVNDETAMTLAAVYACNRVLATAFASLPVGLFRTETIDGKKQTTPADNRPEHALVAETPSLLYTSYIFRHTMALHLGLRGNAYARIYRNGRGGAIELQIRMPDDVRLFFDNSGRLWYEVRPNAALGYPGEREILRPDEILHIKIMSTDGIVGRSPIQAHRDTIGIGLSNRDYVLNIHAQGGRVRGALKHPGKLGIDGVTSLRTNFKSAINSGEFPVLENGVEFQAISLTPADAEFIRTHNLTALDICAIYGVPPHKIAILDRATFSNIEHQGIEYVQETLLPTVKNWEPELKRKLLPVDIQRNHHYRFNLDGRMRGDLLSRYRAYAIARQWGWKNADEIRDLENENPLPDSQGELYLTPLNMIPADQVENQFEGDPNTDNTTDPNNEQGNDTGTKEKQPAAA